MQFSQLLKNVPVVVALVFSCVSAVSQAQAPGSLSGHVQTEDGKPVEGARIVAHPTVSKGGAVPSSKPVKSGADGSYEVSGLAPGQYQICVRDQKAGLLDPCQWSTSPPTATITATGEADIPPITLKKGRLLEVHITDDAGVMMADRAKPKLLIGIWQDNGLFTNVPLRSADAKGRLHAQYVPYDKPLQLSVASAMYVITDEHGAPVDLAKGHGKQVSFPPGESPIKLTFHATGVKP